MLAPNAPLRAAVTALGRDTAAITAQPALVEPMGGEAHYRSPARTLWARLMAHIYEVFPLVCTHCGTQMQIMSFVTETASVIRILAHIGEPAKAPVLPPARGSPTWEAAFDQPPVFDPLAAAPEPVFELEPTLTGWRRDWALSASSPPSARCEAVSARRGCCPASPMHARRALSAAAS